MYTHVALLPRSCLVHDPLRHSILSARWEKEKMPSFQGKSEPRCCGSTRHFLFASVESTSNTEQNRPSGVHVYGEEKVKYLLFSNQHDN